MQRRLFLFAIATLSISGCARKKRAPMYVEDQQVSEVTEGPPAARTEIQPPRPDGDVVWIGGRWKLQGGAWTWQPGRWVVKPYKNAIWVPGRWQKRGPAWIWVQGHWI